MNEDIFACPSCKKDLIKEDDQMNCVECKKRYPIKDDVYLLRQEDGVSYES